MSRITRSAVAALALGLLVGAVVPTGGQAATPKCQKHKNELVRSGGGVLWTSNGSTKNGTLYVCTAYYGDKPVQRKLGPWTKQSKLAFDGSSVLWTVRTKEKNGARPADRIWAADGPYGVWLKGLRLTTGPTQTFDDRIARLAVRGNAAAWVTTQGVVMFASESPNGSEPESVGEGTPGAAAPVVPGVTDDPSLSAADTLSYPQGLQTSLKPSGKRLLVGRWTALAGADFADTLQLRDTGGGDGDECGGVSEYEVTVRPLADQPRVGATWMSDWTSTSEACTS